MAGLRFTRIQIEGFRALREVELDELRQVNLFVGPNNAKKTSILEALRVHANPAELSTWLATARQREVSIRGATGPIPMRPAPMDAIRWLFPYVPTPENELFKSEIKIASLGSDGSRVTRALYQEERRVIVDEVDEVEISDGAEDDHEESLLGAAPGAEIPQIRRSGRLKVKAFVGARTYEEEYVLDDPGGNYPVHRHRQIRIPSATILPYSHRVDVFYLRWFSDAVQAGYDKEVSRLMRSLDDNIQGFEILAPSEDRTQLFMRHKSMGLVPLSALGDGVRRGLLIALKIPTCEGGILLIDEIEQGLHVSALTKAYDWLVHACTKWNVQLFATTHSVEAIDAIARAEADHKDQLAIYRLERDKAAGGVQRFGGRIYWDIRNEMGTDPR